MDLPPPVPPKDTPPKHAMRSREISTVPPSGSKRKREAHDENSCEMRNGRRELAEDSDIHTPQKRNRSTSRQSGSEEIVDNTPGQSRGVRRQQGLNNLSNMNLRHAAQQQERTQAQQSLQARGSKFQEGSLTDRPSDKPPSAFTRMIRTDSGNIQLVDDLMADYHDDVDRRPGARATSTMLEVVEPSRPTVDASIVQQPVPANEGVFSRWGRSIAASMHPVKLWKDVWSEAKDELTQKNLADLERKRLIKEEYERRYAHMKANGQFSFKPSFNFATSESSTLHDSGVSMSTEGGARDTRELHHARCLASHNSSLTLAADYSGLSDTPRPASVMKTIKSRLSFHRPSLANLRGDLKRLASNNDLLAPVEPSPIARDSSSSVSPVKTGFHPSDTALKPSASKLDLRKQHKLSKRVSDLEVKLRTARMELDDALVQASPMPTMRGRHEKLTSGPTLKRPKYVPRQLPSLPSERLLDPASIVARDEGEDIGMTKEAKVDMDDAEETIKARVPRKGFTAYPRRVTSLIRLDNTTSTNESQDTMVDTAPGAAISATSEDHENMESSNSSVGGLTNPNIADHMLELSRGSKVFVDVGASDVQPTSDQLTTAESPNDETPNKKAYNNEYAHGDVADEVDEIDDNSTEHIAAEQPDTHHSKPAIDSSNYAILDAKLKALDASVNASKKNTSGKKRKSAAEKADLKEVKLSKDADSDDDSDWSSGKGKRKRKSGGSGGGRNAGATKTGGATGKGVRVTKITKEVVSTSQVTMTEAADDDIPTVLDASTEDVASPLIVGIRTPPTAHSTIVLTATQDPPSTSRNSIDSQAAPLEPVYEEDESETSPSTSNFSDDPLNKPAFFKSAACPRERSASPKKVGQGAEEKLMLRAAEAVWKTRDASGEEAGRGGDVEGQKGRKPDFEWPEDVF